MGDVKKFLRYAVLPCILLIVFLVQGQWPMVHRHGALWSDHPQWWQFFTCNFMSGNWIHLVFNALSMTVLYVESYCLDIQDRVTAVTNIEGQAMTFGYSVGSMVTNLTRFDGSRVATTYDAAGRKASVSYLSASNIPLSTISRTYYADSQLKTVSDGTSSISNTYDRLNRLTGVSASNSVSSVYSVMNYSYDPVGNVTNSVVDLGGSSPASTAYEYDAAERLTGISTTEGTDTQSFVYAYAPENGKVSSVTNSESGIVTTYAYDIMDRPTNISYRTSSGSLIRSLDCQYDALGMITNRVVSDDNSQLSVNRYQYDTINRLVSESALSGSASLRETSYAYDLAGNRTSVIAVDGSGDPVTNTYTLCGSPYDTAALEQELSSLQDQRATVQSEIDAASAQRLLLLYAIITQQNNSGNTGSGGYTGPSESGSGSGGSGGSGSVSGGNSDNIANLQSQMNAVDVELRTLYSEASSIESQIQRVNYLLNITGGNRLASVVSDNGTVQSFEYDEAGNTTNIVSEAGGQQSEIGLAWNEKYQLTSAVRDSLFDIQYSYDVLGRRISRAETLNSEPGTTNTEYSIYNGNQVAADLDGNGNVIRTYTWGPGIDNLLAMTVYGSETNTYYALKDHQNSVLAFTDASGAVVESYEYDAWGRILDVKDASGNSITNHQSQIGNRYLWQGREYDFETGLYYFRARWYNPETGRWLSKDPIGISGGLNLYAFCGNNPVNFIDPSGLDVAYLNDSEGAGGAGHAAGAVGNDDSGWTYYSFAANNPFTSSDNLTVQTYDTYADMMNANPRYENSIVYPTDAASDAAANRAGNLYNGAPYDLLIQNCDDVASRILRDAGVNVNHSLTPNGTFKNQAAGCKE